MHKLNYKTETGLSKSLSAASSILREASGKAEKRWLQVLTLYLYALRDTVLHCRAESEPKPLTSLAPIPNHLTARNDGKTPSVNILLLPHIHYTLPVQSLQSPIAIHSSFTLQPVQSVCGN